MFHFILKAKSALPQYSGTSNNGRSEKQTTSVEWTNCLPPSDHSILSVHFYLWDTDNLNLCPPDSGQTSCPVKSCGHTNILSRADKWKPRPYTVAVNKKFTFRLRWTSHGVTVFIKNAFVHHPVSVPIFHCSVSVSFSVCSDCWCEIINRFPRVRARVPWRLSSSLFTVSQSMVAYSSYKKQRILRYYTHKSC